MTKPRFYAPPQVASTKKVELSEPLLAVSVSNEEVQQEIARIDQVEQQKEQEQLQRQKALELKTKNLEKKQQKLAETINHNQAKQQDAQRKLDLQRKELNKLLANQSKVEDKLKHSTQELTKTQQDLKKSKDKLLNTQLKTLHAKEHENIDKQLGDDIDNINSQGQRRVFVESEIEKIKITLHKKMSSLWVAQPQFLGKNLTAVLNIEFDKTGKVVNSFIAQSSGNDALDLSVKIAADKLQMIELPNDPDVYRLVSNIRFTFKPDEM